MRLFTLILDEKSALNIFANFQIILILYFFQKVINPINLTLTFSHTLLLKIFSEIVLMKKLLTVIYLILMCTSPLIFKYGGKSEIWSPIYFTAWWCTFQINRVGLSETLYLTVWFRKAKISKCHAKRFRYAINLKIIKAMVNIHHRDVQNKQYNEQNAQLEKLFMVWNNADS